MENIAKYCKILRASKFNEIQQKCCKTIATEWRSNAKFVMQDVPDFARGMPESIEVHDLQDAHNVPHAWHVQNVQDVQDVQEEP